MDPAGDAADHDVVNGELIEQALGGRGGHLGPDPDLGDDDLDRAPTALEYLDSSHRRGACTEPLDDRPELHGHGGQDQDPANRSHRTQLARSGRPVPVRPPGRCWHPDPMATAFRRLERSDFPRLSEWLAAPHVARWWRHGHDRAAVEADFGPMVDGEDPTEAFVIEEDGWPIGLIQRYRFDENEAWDRTVAVGTAPRPAAGIDY